MTNHRMSSASGFTLTLLLISSATGFIFSPHGKKIAFSIAGEESRVGGAARWSVPDQVDCDEKVETTISTVDDGEGPAVVNVEKKILAVPCPDCELCDGSGRILGGIGTVLEWWPIKAYRPCPNFVARGGRYVRSGQGLDEIAFGRIQNEEP